MFDFSYRQTCKGHFINNEILTLPSIYMRFWFFKRLTKTTFFQIRVSSYNTRQQYLLYPTYRLTLVERGIITQP